MHGPPFAPSKSAPIFAVLVAHVAPRKTEKVPNGSGTPQAKHPKPLMTYEEARKASIAEEKAKAERAALGALGGGDDMVKLRAPPPPPLLRHLQPALHFKSLNACTNPRR